MKRQKNYITKIINFFTFVTFLILVFFDKDTVFLLNLGIVLALIIVLNNLAYKKSWLFIFISFSTLLILMPISYTYWQKTLEYLFLICATILISTIVCIFRGKISEKIQIFFDSAIKYYLIGGIALVFLIFNLIPVFTLPDLLLNKYLVLNITNNTNQSSKTIKISMSSDMIINYGLVGNEKNPYSLDFLFARYNVQNSLNYLKDLDRNIIIELIRSGQFDKFERMSSFLNTKYLYVYKDILNFNNILNYDLKLFWPILDKGQFVVFRANNYFKDKRYICNKAAIYDSLEVFDLFNKDELVADNTVLVKLDEKNMLPDDIPKDNLVIKNISDAIDNVKDQDVRIKFDDKNRIPAFLFAAETYHIPIELTNIGNVPLLNGNEYPINIGYHLYSIDKKSFVIWDSIRTHLNCSLLPDERVIINIPIQTYKLDSGKYILYLDLVRENKHWFSEIGMPVYKKNIYIDSVEYKFTEELVAFTKQKYEVAEVKDKTKYKISYSFDINESGDYLILIPNKNSIPMKDGDIQYFVDESKPKIIANGTFHLKYAKFPFVLIDEIFLGKGEHTITFTDSDVFLDSNGSKISDYLIFVKEDGSNYPTNEYIVESYPQKLIIDSKNPNVNGLFVNLLDYLYLNPMKK